MLVQPGLTSSAAYRGVVAGLAEQFLVVTFDSRGHGHSTNPSGEFSYELITKDTAALIDALGLERPVVGGWSDGGHVALKFGLRHPGRARALIVGAAFTDFESQRANVRTWFQVDSGGKVDADAFAREHAETVLPVMQHMHPYGVEQIQAIVQMEATMLLTCPGLTAE